MSNINEIPDYSEFLTKLYPLSQELHAALLAKDWEEAEYLAKELATQASGIAIWAKLQMAKKDSEIWHPLKEAINKLSEGILKGMI